ncbi:hypothetical protein HNQ09_002260 [Deinococcus budaensis]|uniref:Uncharacterized protein n=1 Tax=Deinococcus budaensis TaxID=1665626 RepID=A0A7W8LQP5_9DEIO|nr:hypothetical protein [Deinococcus budaensis]
MAKQAEDAGELDDAQEVPGFALVTGSTAAEELQPSNRALDLPAILYRPAADVCGGAAF